MHVAAEPGRRLADPPEAIPGREGAGAGAALVLRALRQAALTGCWPRVELAFRDACGAADSRAAACLLRVLLQGLARGARRPLRAGLPGTPAPSHDESALLQLIAAAQHGEAARLAAGACWLARPVGAGTLAAAAHGLGAVLARSGVVLPRPRSDQAVQRPLSGRIAAAAS